MVLPSSSVVCIVALSMCALPPIDGHHCLKSGDIPKTEGGQILPHLCDIHACPMIFYCYKGGFVRKITLHGTCPCLPPTTFMGHVLVLRLSPPTIFKKCAPINIMYPCFIQNPYYPSAAFFNLFTLTEPLR